ncbi:MAG: ybaL 1, partial [Thermoleophilia bacterium]|nr:ybaL 1 [Thermoleophilia bacterium]
MTFGTLQGLALSAASPPHGGSIDAFTDIVIVLGVCVVFGLLAQRLKQNVLVGYLLAGVVLGGPASLGIVHDIGSFSFMGEVGIALLLFTVGLDLPIAKVRTFGATALIAGGLQVALTCVLAGGIAFACGLNASAALVVGFAVAMS